MSTAVSPDVAHDWFAAMRRGDFEAAWRATDRIELPRRAAQGRPGFERAPSQLHWDGTAPAGRSVIVRCEHGLGDTLMFMRFLPLLRSRELHFLVQPPLVDLLRGLPGLGTVRDYWTDDPPPPHEVDMEVMELAYALRVPSPPPPYPHLAQALPDAGKLVPSTGRLRVGLLWSVSDWEQERSIPLEALEPLFGVDGIDFFSLQQGRAATDPRLAAYGITRLSAHTGSLSMAAAAMRRMDVVITPDGMAAHLAGTLGVPTWVLLLHEADWRWMDERADSPWYPSVRLFRQPLPGDWPAVARTVTGALGALSRRAG